MDMFKEDEVVNMSLYANPQASMANLAEATGGFLIANTNDTAKPSTESWRTCARTTS